MPVVCTQHIHTFNAKLHSIAQFDVKIQRALESLDSGTIYDLFLLSAPLKCKKNGLDSTT